MKKILATLFLFLPLTSASISEVQAKANSQSQPAASIDPLKVKEYKLSNGMTVWLNEDHNQPKVYGAVVVRAGGVDCPGTGIAHYLEHLLFKGTDKMGTIDYDKEKPYLDSISNKYAELRLTTDEARRNEIQKEINQISLRAAQFAIPNEFNTMISNYGGTELNAGTTYDFTYYHNEFSPQFINQWLQLNSDRLINPVFRLFQGELEAVYEEKNRQSDNMIGNALDKVTEAIFPNTPYAKPVIGTTDELKNPNLQQMMDFFNKYYVANNMCLVLCGDIKADTLMTQIENTFGRLRQGEVPAKTTFTKPSYKGKKMELKLPIPIIKAAGRVYNAPAIGSSDEQALNIACAVLSNEQETGLMDSLMLNSEIMVGGTQKLDLGKASILGFIYVPKLLGSTKKAEAKCLAQIERLKAGDFSTALFEACKRSYLKDVEQGLEGVTARAETMVRVYGEQQRDWTDYLNDVEKVKKLTKADIVAAANKYFNDNYLSVTKKYGTYPKDRVSQPGFTPVKPKNKDKQSEYAKQLAQMPVADKGPKMIDVNNDAVCKQLAPMVKLYTVNNPYNDIFNLSLVYHIGSNSNKTIGVLPGYINELGTDSLTQAQLRQAFQNIGASMDWVSGSSSFELHLTGYDKDLPKVLQLTRHFIDKAKGNDKKLEDIVDAKKVNVKSAGKDVSDASSAMQKYLLYGNKSSYLNTLNLQETKALKSDDLLALFHDVLKNQMMVTYSGNKSAEEVAQVIKQYLPVNEATRPYKDAHVAMKAQDSRKVYIFDIKDARQNMVTTLTTVKPFASLKDRAIARIYGEYMGGGMGGLMFQEIREFRSMAYSTRAGMLLNEQRFANENATFLTKSGTQSDKTLALLSVTDSLLNNLPIDEVKLESCKRNILSQLNNEYPSFRKIPGTVGSYHLYGYKEDPGSYLAQYIPDITSADLQDFFNRNIKGKPYSVIIVGSKKKMNLQALAKYGEVVEVKKEEIYK